MFLILILDTKNNCQLYSLLWDKCLFLHLLYKYFTSVGAKTYLCLYEP